MIKAENQLDQWLDRMTDHVLAHGLGAANLRPLAKAAGTSDRMLLYYFKDKAALITAIFGRVAMRLTIIMMERGSNEPLPYDACLIRTVDILGSAIFDPYLRLFLQMAARAAEGDPLFRAVGEQLGRMYFEWAKSQLASDNDDARNREAALLLQRVEGMVFLRAIGLDDVNRLAFSN